ncbi:MAG: Spy/CpxP family protein refolding chaperone [Parvibaculum sp.]
MSLRKINFRQNIFVNACATLIFILAVSGVAAVAPATAQNAETAQVQNASWFGGRSGWGGWWGEDRSMAQRCGDRMDHVVERLDDHARDEVTFTAEEEAAWNGLLQSIRDSGVTLQSFCSKLDAAHADEKASAPERLALAEEGVVAGLKMLQAVRPAFDNFYAALDSEKREKLDELANHHHGGWH